MPRLRVALAQMDVTVGDLDGNCRAVVAHAVDAAAQGAHLLAVPEMAVTGYPPEDLVLRPSFRRASAERTERLAAELADAGCGDLAVVVGYLDDDDPGARRSDGRVGRPRNAAALCSDGRLLATYYKHHLPNYGVFDEDRYFVPGDRFTVVRLHGVDVALTICEDLWQDGGPFRVARAAGAGLVVNINGSPYERNKDDVRLPLVQRRAAEAGCPVLYVNTCGAQDELVFDGDSMVVAADGTVALRAPQFVEGLYLVDLDLAAADADVTGAVEGMRVKRHSAEGEGGGNPPVGPAALAVKPPMAERISDLEEVWRALVLGTRDYAVKNGFRTVVIAISGGIDSAVVAAIAADALGGDNVHGVSMPSAYSSAHSRTDAADLAERIGATYREVPVAGMVDAFVGALQLTGVAEENVQARVRGTTLMGLSNQSGHLVLATGNKSELAVGYSTIYGDAVGGFAPLKDVPKSTVWELARWRNERARRAGHREPIPENSIVKPPSAELRPGQLDSDSLPDYAVLDAVIAGYVDRDLGLDELVAEGHDPGLVERVGRMIDAAEWKRRQYPPGPKISLKAFGRDRRLPITNRWRERPTGD
ncbi:MAG: NAD+ synthase [bacterium]